MLKLAKQSDVPPPAASTRSARLIKIAGDWYYPKEKTRYDNEGVASWYGPNFQGRRTANGEIFDMNLLTAAHPTLPMPVMAKVTNLENGKSLVVRINDRGPFAKNREIDLSQTGGGVAGLSQKGHGAMYGSSISAARPLYDSPAI